MPEVPQHGDAGLIEIPNSHNATPVARNEETPNRSVEATHNGIGPRGSLAHHAPRGPMPLRAPHLQR